MKAVREQGATLEGAGGVCILGKRRSGGSVVAGCLHHLGVHLGEGVELQAADAANPTGSWETPEIVALNERVLAELGANGGIPSELPDGWEGSPTAAAMQEEARRVLEEQFAIAPWAWKDHRTAITLPFWQGVLGDLRHVICVRNPLDVALSLGALGDDAGLDSQLRDWVAVYALIVERTSGRPRLIVEYEDLLADPVRTTRRLARFVGLDGAADDEEVARAIERFVDPTLPLFRTPPEDAIRDPRTTREAVALYRELRRLAEADEDGEAAAWEAAETLARRLRTRPTHARPAGGRAAGTGPDADVLAKRLAATERRLTDARAAAKRGEVVAVRAGKLEAELEGKQARVEELEASVRELSSAREELDRQVAAGRARAEELERDLERSTQGAAQLKHEVEEATRRADRQRELAAEREREVERLKTRATELQQIAARELESVAARDEGLLVAQAKIADLLGQVERSKATLEDLRRIDAQHQETIEAMRASRSWRVTRPMRRASIWSRRLTRRPGPYANP